MNNRIIAKLESFFLRDYPVIQKQREKKAYLQQVALPKVRDTRILFIHIPKAAGSSIQNAVYSLNSWTHNTLLDFENELDPILFESCYKFAFVRHPYDRLYSAYKYLSKGGNNATDKYWSEKYLRHYKTFEDFVLEFINHRNILKYIHFVPQINFVLNKQNQLNLDFIGKYENLSADFRLIKKELNLTNDLPKLNITDIGAGKNQYIPKNTRIKKIIFNTYKNDFTFFKYDPFL